MSSFISLLNPFLLPFRPRPRPDSPDSSSSSEDNSHTETPDTHFHYPRNPRDVYAAAHALRRFLPWELVKQVLDTAEYWAVLSVHEHLTAPALRITQDDSPKLVATLPIDTFRTRAVPPVRKVVFSVTSHDQGWRTNADGGSWTWFDVVVGGRAPIPLVANRPAVSAWQTHRIEWWADDADDANEAKRTLLRGLANGHVLNVQGCARFPGWINFVREARIDVYVSVLH